MSIACVKTYPLSNGHGWIGTGAVHWVPEVLPPLWSSTEPPLELHWASRWSSTGLPLEQHWNLHAGTAPTPLWSSTAPPLWSSTRPPLKLHWPPALEQHWKGANSGLTTSEYEG